MLRLVKASSAALLFEGLLFRDDGFLDTGLAGKSRGVLLKKIINFKRRDSSLVLGALLPS